MINLVAQAKKNQTFRTNLVNSNVADIAAKCSITIEEARRLQHAAAVFAMAKGE